MIYKRRYLSKNFQHEVPLMHLRMWNREILGIDYHIIKEKYVYIKSSRSPVYYPLATCLLFYIVNQSEQLIRLHRSLNLHYCIQKIRLIYRTIWLSLDILGYLPYRDSRILTEFLYCHVEIASSIAKIRAQSQIYYVTAPSKFNRYILEIRINRSVRLGYLDSDRLHKSIFGQDSLYHRFCRSLNCIIRGFRKCVLNKLSYISIIDCVVQLISCS